MKFLLTLGPTAALLALLLGPAPALSQEFDMEGMRKLLDEGTEEFKHAGNTMLSRPERNKHIRASYDLLNKALEMLDTWCEAHPEDIERLDQYFGQIARMRYFLRKEAPNGILNDDKPQPRVPRPDWPAKPPPDLHDPAMPPGAKPPQPSPSNPAEPAPAPSKPYEDVVKQHMEFAEEYEKKHPHDPVGLRDIYLDILEHAPKGSEAYLTAMKRFSEINANLKDVYRQVRDRDIDENERSGSEERKLVHKLADDLDHKEDDVRLRAAEYLGRLGSGEGARYLVKQLFREKQPKVREQIQNALADVGGARVCTELAAAKKKRNLPAMRGALSVLESLAARSSVEARLASNALGDYTLCGKAAIAKEALQLLEGIGGPGVFGLMKAARLKDHYIRMRVIESLGKTGEGIAGNVLGGFLLVGIKGAAVKQRDAAISAINAIGKPSVPYIGRFLANPHLRKHVHAVLKKLTGQSFKTDQQVQAWWKRQRNS